MRHRLIVARKEAGLTQEQIADAVGIHRTHYNAVELGRRTPSLRVATAIASVLGKPMEHLFLPSGATNRNVVA